MTTQTSPPKTVRVRLPATSHLLRVGRYARGESVAVSPDEAQHLITVKGFERVPETITPTDSQEPTP